jgi:hypothetical protein
MSGERNAQVMYLKKYDANLKDRRAVSPAISTVILTAGIVVMVLVAMSFSNGFLNTRMAESEFTTNKQFMLTTALQLDDIAWTIGRTETVRYSSRYGQVKFQSPALEYSFEVDNGNGWQQILTYQTGIILYNMPANVHTLGNNYFERVYPSDGSFLQQGASASVAHVYVIEKLPMAEGNYTRVVVAPSIRWLESTIIGLSQTKYLKFYAPALISGGHPQLSQSITLIGNNVTKYVLNGVNAVRVNVTYPNAGIGFDADFFKFQTQSVELTGLGGAVVEFYVGEVKVSLGMHA